MREAQQRCDSREFVEWWVEYQANPWGEERDDLRIAQLCTLVAHGLGDKKAKVSDWMFDDQKKKQQHKTRKSSVVDMRKVLMAKTAMFNAMKNQGKKKG